LHARRAALQTLQQDRPSSMATRTQPHTVTAETRHTHATALLLSGTPPHVVMRRLGHADIQTTLSTYGWVTEDAEMRTLAQWRSYVAGWKGLHHDHTD
ncbi:tyrosine-type recombinase/integrase, partial [Mycolicibacterium novocastrense]